jgi:hypothetical protein
MTDKDPKSLVTLARSWNFPAELKLMSQGFKSDGYDYTERAYRLTADKKISKLTCALNGSKDSPIVNPAFVIKHWDKKDIKLTINGKPVLRGKDFRYAVEYDAEGTPSVIVWIKLQAENVVNIELN